MDFGTVSKPAELFEFCRDLLDAVVSIWVVFHCFLDFGWHKKDYHNAGDPRTCLAEAFGFVLTRRIFARSSGTSICWNDSKHAFSEQPCSKRFFLAGIRVFIQKINSFQVFFANLGSRFTPLSASKKSGHRGRIVQLEAFEDRCLVAFLLDVTCISAVLAGRELVALTWPAHPSYLSLSNCHPPCLQRGPPAKSQKSASVRRSVLRSSPKQYKSSPHR